MKTTIKNLRHGDIALIKIEKLPEGLTASKSKTLLEGGSGGNAHTFTSGTFYPKTEGQNLIGYLSATPKTRLGHKEHGDPVVPAGIYKVLRQVEFHPDGMKRAVID